MGYEVSRRRVYGPTDTYSNGAGCSVLIADLGEAQAQYDSFCKQDIGYRAAVFLVDLRTGAVLRQSGPSMAEVDRAMHAAWRRRYQRRAA